MKIVTEPITISDEDFDEELPACTVTCADEVCESCQ